MSVHITFVQSTGEPRELTVDEPRTVLEAGLNAGVPELESECGGACTCAACHVLVEPTWLERLPQASKIEQGILSMVEQAQPESRLACQIRLSEALDGLTLHTLPPCPES